MRIVGGIYRSRKLAEFKGEEIRPTSDCVRESLFNILRPIIGGAVFLDLYCGTGAVGIEALSRGAKRVVFNDASKDSLTVLKKNLTALKIEDGVSVHNRDARTFVSLANEKFDIVFLDPPYKTGAEDVMNMLSELLSDDGIIVYENEKPIEYTGADLVKYDQRKYGRAYLNFFKKSEGGRE